MPGRPTIWIVVKQGPTVLAVGAGGGCLDIFSLVYHLSFLTSSLWETARYRLKYCLKGPLTPNQPTNQSTGCVAHARSNLSHSDLPEKKGMLSSTRVKMKAFAERTQF